MNDEEPDKSGNARKVLAREKKRSKVRRVVKWTLLSLGAVIVVAGGFWAYSYLSIDAQIKAEMDRYRAAGQPVDLADFDPPPVKDEDNAAKFYLAAARSIKLRDQTEDYLMCGDLYLRSDRMELAGRIVGNNAKAFELAVVIRGRRYPSAWGPSKKTAEQLAAMEALRVLGRLEEETEPVVNEDNDAPAPESDAAPDEDDA